jgi:Transposase DDE domain
MILYATDPLFAWARLEDHPQLATLKELLEILPDHDLLAALRRARGRGRDDYPIPLLWGVVLCTVALRHCSFESCLAELQRNPALCRLLGVKTVDDLPKPWSVSRFLDVLGEPAHYAEVRKVFDVLVRRLGVAIPDLGQDTAGDSAALSARPKKNAAAVAEEVAQGLPQPSGGRKEYKDDNGVVVEAFEWFGYKHHLLVDVKHEVPLAWHISDTKSGDNEGVAALVEQAKANLPAGRIKSLAYDKAADDEKVHELLHDEQIKPLIKTRQMWKDELERQIPSSGDRRYPLNVLHDEAGTVYCYDRVSDPPVRHKMAYMGYEKDREKLKYRCPARHEGWACPSDERCNEARAFGLIVRVDPTVDLRRFPPIPRATKQFEQKYKGRTAVERVNARTKVFWGVDDGNITGACRFHAYMGVVMVVCVGLATLLAKTPRREGSMGDTRLGPIALALQEALEQKASDGKADQGERLAASALTKGQADSVSGEAEGSAGCDSS